MKHLKIEGKRSYLLIALFIILFALVSLLSFSAIRQMQGNARVVNYVGIVRGATQKLVKRELQGYPDDALIARLDTIVDELITGVGPNDLVVLHDETYLDNMRQVQVHWVDIKENILLERAGEPNRLFDLSEEYFNLVDRTVSSAELFSERQVTRSQTLLIGVNVVVVVLMVIGAVYYIRMAAIKRRAEALDKIAYIDALTQLPNRAGCNREIGRLTDEPPEVPIAVFMFDMNNLKRVNDEKGHQGGDRVIADFARIVGTEGMPYGFVGRYGGDEFIAIFENADEPMAQKFVSAINEKIVAYNLLHVDGIEKISFAVGYTIESLQTTTMETIINEADRKMYAVKRQMKENRTDVQ